LAAKLAHFRAIMIAGGITPENVANALRQTKAVGVDCASGIESEPGIKDMDKMRRLMRNAHDFQLV
jgi:phosphoribosylanthranilate isomerase